MIYFSGDVTHKFTLSVLKYKAKNAKKTKPRHQTHSILCFICIIWPTVF